MWCMQSNIMRNNSSGRYLLFCLFPLFCAPSTMGLNCHERTVLVCWWPSTYLLLKEAPTSFSLLDNSAESIFRCVSMNNCNVGVAEKCCSQFLHIVCWEQPLLASQFASPPSWRIWKIYQAQISSSRKRRSSSRWSSSSSCSSSRRSSSSRSGNLFAVVVLAAAATIWMMMIMMQMMMKRFFW